jgi:hypothetical protein
MLSTTGNSGSNQTEPVSDPNPLGPDWRSCQNRKIFIAAGLSMKFETLPKTIDKRVLELEKMVLAET